MKIIYLDIDGVLNSQDNADVLFKDWQIRNKYVNPYISKSDHERFKDGIYKDKYGILFDKRCVSWLNILIQETNAKLVISSDWRKSGINTLVQMWRNRKLCGEIYDITPIHDDAIRENEILESVRYINPEKWVAIDDLTLDLPYTNFVNTDYEYGFSRNDYLKAKKILNG